MKKEVAEKIKFDPEVQPADDLKFWIDVIYYNYSISFNPYPTAYWLINHSDKFSNNQLKIHIAVDKALNKLYLEGKINFKRLYQEFTEFKKYTDFLKFLINNMFKRSATPYSLIQYAAKEGMKHSKVDSFFKEIYKKANILKKELYNHITSSINS